MLRDPNLHAYSHQHQHALALCVRIDRALRGELDARAWNREIAHAFATEIEFHFVAEERFLFPVAANVEIIATVVAKLLEEHATLRAFAAAARRHELDAAGLRDFATALTSHVRTEERELFELCQGHLSPNQLHGIHVATDTYFKANGISPNACPLPAQAT